MVDLISRQAAIDVAVQSLVDWDGMFRQEANCRIRDAINELPSAEPNPYCSLAGRLCDTRGKEFAWCLTCPHISEEDRTLVKKAVEPKKGRWIEDAETFYKAINKHGGGVDENTPYFTDDIACSKCLAKFSVIDNETERFDFCPHCGAKMLGEDGEEWKN